MLDGLMLGGGKRPIAGPACVAAAASRTLRSTRWDAGARAIHRLPSPWPETCGARRRPRRKSFRCPGGGARRKVATPCHLSMRRNGDRNSIPASPICSPDWIPSASKAAAIRGTSGGGHAGGDVKGRPELVACEIQAGMEGIVENTLGGGGQSGESAHDDSDAGVRLRFEFSSRPSGGLDQFFRRNRGALRDGVRAPGVRARRARLCARQASNNRRSAGVSSSKPA